METSVDGKILADADIDTSQRLYQEGLDRPVAVMTASGTGGISTTYLHANPRGDIYLATDERGAVLERYGYTLYGEMRIFPPDGTARSQSIAGHSFGFGISGRRRTWRRPSGGSRPGGGG